MAAILPISSVSSGRIKTYSFPAVSLSPSPESVFERHSFFSLEKKRNNVQDSNNSDFHIIVLILRLTHTPEEARSANVVSTEGEMFIVADTECFLSIVYGWRYYLCAEGIIYVSYSYVHTSTFVLDLAGLLCILRTFSPNRAAGVAFLPRVRAGLCTVHTWSSMYLIYVPLLCIILPLVLEVTQNASHLLEPN